MKDILGLLIYSLDNKLTEAEQKRLNEALESSEELRVERNKYLKLRSMVSDISISHKPHFTDQVIQKWKLEQQQNVFGNNVIKLFPKVAAVAALFLLFTWSVIYFSGEKNYSENLVGIENISPEEAYSLLEY